MLTAILNPLLVTVLIWLSLIDCAYLVLGPLEVTSDTVQNDLHKVAEDQAKALPKREFKVSREKQKSKSITSNIEDDVEIIEQIPCCTNIFKSSINTKEKKNAKVDKSKNETKLNENTKEGKCESLVQRSHLVKLKEKSTIIEKLKRELAKEREKVKNLTKELSTVKKMCDYTYEDDDSEFIPPENSRIQTIKSSVDLYNLISTKKDDQFPDSKSGGAADEDFRNLNTFSKSKIKEEELNNQLYTNEDHINKDLFKDNVYQIPNFSVNDQKNYKNPLYGNDISILNPNAMGYGNIPLPKSNSVFPYKDANVHDDVLKTLYPQFFLEDPGDTIERYSNAKRGSRKSLVEPGQIYANNMKQLTAPYKIFPGHMNPDYRFYNVRDKRGNLTSKDLEKDKSKLIHFNKFAENDLNFDISPDSDIVIKVDSSVKREKKKVDSTSGDLNDLIDTTDKSDGDIVSAFKIKNAVLKLEDSSDGDDNLKENYFESSKEIVSPKKEVAYNRLLKKYLKRVKAYGDNGIGNSREFRIENNEPEDESVTDPVDTDKEYDFENTKHQKITSIEVKKAQSKKPPIDSLYLKKYQQINGTRELSFDDPIKENTNESDQEENIETAEKMIKRHKTPLVDHLKRDDPIKHIKKNENQSLKDTNNDDSESSKDDVDSNSEFTEPKKEDNLDIDDLNKETNDDEADEDEITINTKNNDADDSEEINEIKNNSDEDISNNLKKDQNQSPKMKRGRFNIDSPIDTLYTSKKSMRRNKIIKAKKSGRHQDKKYFKQNKL